jgi:hypothetical protein
MAEIPRECESGNGWDGMSLRGTCRAIRADTLDFNGCGRRFEAPLRRRLIDRHAYTAVAHLQHPVASRADEELRGVDSVMGVVGPAAIKHMGTTDKGRESLDLMDEALRGEEFQRAIDRGGRGGTAVFPESVQEIIGPGGAGIVQNEAENQSPLFRQAQLPPVAERFRLIQQALRLWCE